MSDDLPDTFDELRETLGDEADMLLWRSSEVPKLWEPAITRIDPSKPHQVFGFLIHDPRPDPGSYGLVVADHLPLDVATQVALTAVGVVDRDRDGEEQAEWVRYDDGTRVLYLTNGGPLAL